MVRVLIVAIACILGAGVTWFFIPAAPLASVDSGQNKKPTSADPQNAVNPKAPWMSAAMRQARAEQLIGDELKYITGNKMLSVDYFAALAPQQMERAMDECAIVLDDDLFIRHNMATHDENSAGGLLALKKPPPLAQLLSCKNLATAYAATHTR